jgi:hypothetical protein
MRVEKVGEEENMSRTGGMRISEDESRTEVFIGQENRRRWGRKRIGVGQEE